MSGAAASGDASAQVTSAVTDSAHTPHTAATTTTPFKSYTDFLHTQRQQWIEKFQADDVYQYAFADIIERYRNLIHRLASEREKRDKLQKLVNEHKIPSSLRITTHRNAQFTDEADHLSLYKPFKDTIISLGQETEKKITEQVLLAREAYIKYLKQLSNTDNYLKSSMETFTKIIHAWADEHDSLHGVTSSIPHSPISTSSASRPTTTHTRPVSENPLAFPVKEALEATKQEVQRMIHDTISKQVSASRKAAMERKRKTEADLKAQETVVAGAHNGQTIAAIARREVTTQLLAAKHQDPPPPSPASTTSRSRVTNAWTQHLMNTIEQPPIPAAALAPGQAHPKSQRTDKNHQTAARRSTDDNSSSSFRRGGGPPNTQQQKGGKGNHTKQ